MKRAPIPPASLLDEDQQFVLVDYGYRDEDVFSWAIFDNGAQECVCVVIVDSTGRDLMSVEAADMSALCRKGLDSVCRNWIARQDEEARYQERAA